jgi:Mg-chelatase subunit ChlD
VDGRLATRFPGARADLALDPAPALPAWLLASLPPDPPPADAHAALQLALRWHQRLLAQRPGRKRVAEAAPAPVLRIQAAAGHADLSAAGPPGLGSPGGGGASQNLPAAPTAHAAAGQPLAGGTLADAGANSADLALPADGPPATGATPAGRTARPRRATGIEAGDPARTTWYDEWDAQQRAYRRHWVAVHERPVAGRDLQALADLRQRHATLVRQIRRRFASPLAGAPRRERRLPDGDAVDLDAALDAQVARRAGHGGADDRLYQARPLRQRSLSVALLLDCSSSTGFAIPDRHAPAHETAPDDVLWMAVGSRPSLASLKPPRRVLDVTKDAAALLCEALQAMGDRHAVFGFSGAGRLQVDIGLVKDFGAPWGATAGAALAALQPQGATRTGAAVRHAAQRLLAEPSRRKVLVVLSDGYPHDSDYGSGANALQHGLQDTAQALREARRAGVASFHLSVDAGAHDYMRRICPANRYWVVDAVETLPTRMLPLVRLLARPA